eukprot:PhM_4_TR18611/c4_g1_i4/m.83761/K10251/HSD17B12, KAR, IFA38; 17beta-estradiol 17-dehydrogenase / very-long-chain 3-oxoacyl-CoA reductase
MSTLPPQIVSGLAIVGAVYAASTLLKIASWLRMSFFVSTNLIKRYGNGTTTPWAVVTGASDGIGKALAMQCARRGLNVVLVSRTLSKLHDVEAEIKKRYPTTEVRIVVLDFAKTTASDVAAAVQKHMSDIDVAVLINNVGIGFSRPLHFDEVPCERYDELIHVNCAAPTHMTYALLPQLKSRKSRSAIVNISSATAVCPFPFVTAYGASKAYNRQFSLALCAELRPLDIDVLTVTPAQVATPMTKHFGDAVAADAMADQTLDKLGAGLDEVRGHRSHDFVIPLMACIPAFLLLKGSNNARDKMVKAGISP